MAIRLTAQQKDELIKAILAEDVEHVEENEDFKIDDLLSVVDKNRSPFVKAAITDEEKEAAKKAATGQMSGALNSYIKRLTGYEGKHDKWEELVEGAINHVKKLSGADKDEVLKQIQEITAAKDLERESAVSEWQTKYTSLEGKYMDRDAIEALRQKFGTLTLEGDKGIHASDYYRNLKDSYHVVYDEAAKDIRLFSKDKPDSPAMNKANTQLLNIDEHAKEYFSARGILKTDTRSKNPLEETNKRIAPAEGKQPFAPSGNPTGLAARQAEYQQAFSD